MIVTKIKRLKDNKSPGIDGITPKLLKEIAEEISVPLAIMFNLSLREGTVPHEWKHANVVRVPIFKKGNRCKAENYRPVSLTSVVCKLLESLLRDHMVDFLETQFIKGYTARVSKRTVVFDKLVRIYGNIIKVGR